MILHLKEKDEIIPNPTRESWMQDPGVQDYVELRDAANIADAESSLTNFNRYYEIYNNDMHVGDIKLFYETEDDIFQNRAQILMVVGDRNQGIGTEALRLLLENIRESYSSVYCSIQRSNIASLKILKRNNFQVEKIDDFVIKLIREL